MARRPVQPTARFHNARRKFLRVFPGGFGDPTYLEWERDYKWQSHQRWVNQLDRSLFRAMLNRQEYREIATRALKIEQQSRHSMIFTFEKMALRDATRGARGAELFASGLYELLHGRGGLDRRFDRWVAVLEALPRRKSRLVTWPVATVFAFLAQPDRHFFLKPAVTRRAALACGIDLPYRAHPAADVYRNVLGLADTVRSWLRDLHPRDMIDIQSFLWVQGSDEY
jgi:CRISPR/Cas system-associated endoribonuclease Cas2